MRDVRDQIGCLAKVRQIQGQFPRQMSEQVKRRIEKGTTYPVCDVNDPIWSLSFDQLLDQVVYNKLNRARGAS